MVVLLKHINTCIYIIYNGLPIVSYVFSHSNLPLVHVSHFHGYPMQPSYAAERLLAEEDGDGQQQDQHPPGVVGLNEVEP